MELLIEKSDILHYEVVKYIFLSRKMKHKCWVCAQTWFPSLITWLPIFKGGRKRVEFLPEVVLSQK